MTNFNYKVTDMSDVTFIQRELLCDLHVVKAEYGELKTHNRASNHIFRIQIKLEHSVVVDVPEQEADLFAAELEALAAIIRSRVIRARLTGDEKH